MNLVDCIQVQNEMKKEKVKINMTGDILFFIRRKDP